MGAVRISQVRWPVDLYERIREEAHERRMSINGTVIELVMSAMARQDREEAS